MALEERKVHKLVRNRRLATALSDASWARFRSWVEYDGRMQQVPVLARGAAPSTSQVCSGCGTLVRTSRWVWIQVCGHCGLVVDRDHTAAVVIREVGQAEATRQGIWDPLRHGPSGVRPVRPVGHTGSERVGTAGLLRVAARRLVAPAGGTRHLPASTGQSINERSRRQQLERTLCGLMIGDAACIGAGLQDHMRCAWPGSAWEPGGWEPGYREQTAASMAASVQHVLQDRKS